MPRNLTALYVYPKAQKIDKSFKLLNKFTNSRNEIYRLSEENHRCISEILIGLVEDFTAILTRHSGEDQLNPDLLEPHVYLGIGWGYIFERLKRMTSEVCRLVDRWYSDPWIFLNTGKEAEDELSGEALQLLETALDNVCYVLFDPYE